MSVRDSALLLAALAGLASCQYAGPGPKAEAKLAPGARPNVLLIVADDLGYQDLGVYGSEIRTPNIDRLAAQGLVLTDFYTAPVCAVTRSMLLTGMDNHRAGVGNQGGRFFGEQPGYEGYLSHRLMTVAERLEQVGYHTYMTGKWHVGYADDQSPAARGFERSFTLLDGGASHYGDMRGLRNGAKARYREDGVMLDSLPADFYSTVAYTDHMIDYIDSHSGDGEPFFGYLAYTSPHWPMQALPEDMAKTRGRYDEGYEVLRLRRFERWKELGYAPADALPPRMPSDVVPWDSLSDEEKALSARTMEVYAAMVERMDADIGRLLDHLRETGQLDNTLVIFIADNGAEGWGNRVFAGIEDASDNSLENIGHPGSFRLIGPGWGEAGSAPFLLRKSNATDGGTHVPAIVSAPGLGSARGRTDAFVSVMDLTPTFLELAGAPEVPADAPADLLPIQGRSFAGLLRGEADVARRESDAVAWEYLGERSIRRGEWKAEWIRPPFGDSTWQLFDLSRDQSERDDVSDLYPDVLASMVDEWNRYAEANGVLVWEDNPTAEEAAATAAASAE